MELGTDRLLGPAGRAEGFLREALRWLYLSEVVVTCAALLLVATSLFADVVAREIFGFGIFGAQKFAVYNNAIAGLLGFVVVVHSGGHLRISLVDRLFPDEWQGPMTRIGDVVSGVICVVLGSYAVAYVRSSARLGETDLLFYAKLWPFQVVLPYIFLASALRYGSVALFPRLRPAEPEAQ
jgi:TRAP-type C4-dicarboxylate transport system permease small subunit